MKSVFTPLQEQLVDEKCKSTFTQPSLKYSLSSILSPTPKINILLLYTIKPRSKHPYSKEDQIIKILFFVILRRKNFQTQTAKSATILSLGERVKLYAAFVAGGFVVHVFPRKDQILKILKLMLKFVKSVSRYI